MKSKVRIGETSTSAFTKYTRPETKKKSTSQLSKFCCIMRLLCMRK